MPSRKFHRKSRLGCAECKERRIKCDETHPACNNCVRIHATCNYGSAKCTPPTPITSSYLSPPSSDTRASQSPRLASSLPVSLPPVSSSFELIDLVLMNHFTAVTALNLFSGDRQRELWQREVPFQAGSNRMLMHGLLAVAALDLSTSETNSLTRSEYQVRAFHHHGLGLQLFNAELARLSPQNFDILFTFGVLLVVWVYASPTAELTVPDLDGLLDKLEMVRGCKKLFGMNKEAILQKPIGRFADYVWSLNEIDQSSSVSEALSYLRSITADPVDATAIDQLQRHLQRYAEGPVDTKTAAGWPALVSAEFWSRLRAHDTTPVLIFAHYAMLVRPCADRWWWMSDWSERILQAAGNALSDADKLTVGWDRLEEQIRSQALDMSTATDYTST